MASRYHITFKVIAILMLSFLTVFAQSEGNAVTFDGTDDYINFSASSNANAFNIDGSFTLEAWIYMDNIGGARTILAKRDFTAGTPPSNTNYALRVDNGSLRLFWRASDNTLIDCFEDATPGGQASISVSTWYHVAAVFDSSTMIATLYVDGSSVYSTAMDSLPEPNTHPLTIGANYSSGAYGNDFDGIIDEIRISNSVRYSGNFNLPSAPFISDSNTVALYHFDKASGLNITDNFISSINNDDGTLQNDADFTTSAPALSSFADNAMDLNGSTDYFTGGDSTALDITTAITLEAWVKPTTNSGSHTIVSKWDTTSANQSYKLSVNNGKLLFVVSQNGTAIDTVVSNSDVNSDRWTHVAGVYDGSNLYVFLNGSLDSTIAYASDIYSSTAGVEVGSYNGANLFEGQVDEVRISNSARYTTDFSVPQANLISDANTALLVHGSHSDYESIAKDASGNNVDLTAQGSAAFSAANYFDVALVAGLNNPGSSNESASGALISMVQFVVDATNTSEDIEMNSLVVSSSGTGDESADIATDGILLYRDINENGVIDSGTDQFINSAVSFSGDDGTATINLPSYNITSGTQVTFLVGYTLSGSAGIGDTFIASVNPGGIDLTGSTSGDNYTATGVVVTGGTKTISSARSLTIAAGVNNPGAQFVAADANSLGVLQIQLSASSADDVTVDSLKLFVSGSITHTSDVDSASLFHDLNDNGAYDNGVDTVLVSGIAVGANDTINFTNILKNVAAGTSQNWLVVYDLNGNASGTEDFALEISTDADVYSNASVTGAPVASATFTVSSDGQLTLGTGVANPGNSNEGVNAQDIVMMQFTLAANETEDIGISRMEFTGSGSGNDAGDFLVALYHDVNANGIYESGTDIQFGSASTYNSDNGTLIFNISPNADTLIATDTRNYILVYDFNENATQGETYQAQISGSDITGTGVTSTSTVSVIGSNVQGGIKTINNIGSLNITFNNKPPAASLTADAADAPIFQFAMTASSTENINMNSITFGEIGTAAATTDILPNGIRLYQDVDDDGILNTDVDQFIGSTSRYGGFEITLDGSDDYIALDANQDQIGGTDPDGITVEAWLYLSSSASGGEKVIASMDRNEYWRLSLNGQRRVYWATQSELGTQNDMTGTAQLTTDTWYHVAAVYEPSTGQKRIYIDGALDATTEPYTDGEVLGSGTARFGFIGVGSEATTYNGNRGPANYWHGEIDEFRISNTVRYTSNFTPQTTPFINDNNSEIIFHFNEGSGSAATNAAIGSGVGGGGLYGQTTFVDATKIIEEIAIIATTGQTIPASQTRNWLLVYDLADSASSGETFQARIPSQYSIDAQGEDFGTSIIPNGTFPINGNAQTISNVGALTMSTGANSPAGQQIPNSVQDMEMLQLQLTASGAESLLVQNITVKSNGSGADNADVDSVYIALDLNSNGVYDLGVDEVKSQKYAYSTDDGTVVIAVNDTLPKSESKNYLIIYDFAGSAVNNNTFSASISLDSYIEAQGLASASSASISGAPVDGSTMSIENSPELTLSPGANNPGASNIVNDAQDVEMIQFNLAASAAEDIDITSIKFIDIGTGDESTAVDSGNVRLYRDVNNNGTLEPLSDVLITSGNVFENGEPGNATTYDGSDDYTNVPDDNVLDVTGDLTIEAWINPSQSAGGTYTVVAKRDFGVGGTPTNYSLRVDDYRMRFFFYSPNGTLRDCFDATQRIFPGSWYHIAGVYDTVQDQMRLYVNGNLVQTTNLVGDIFPLANTYPLNIGRRYRTNVGGNGDSYFNGTIDELRLSDVMRYTGSQFTVSQLPFETDANTRLLMHFDDAIGSGTVADSSGNGLTGTLTNGASLVQSTAPLNGGMTLPITSTSITAGNSEDWLLLYDFNGSAGQDETFQSRVLRPVDIQAVGATSGLNANLSGLPVTGGLKTVLNVGNLTVTVGASNPPASNISADAQDVEMMQFELTASNVENIEVNSITFNAQGTGHDVNDITPNSIRLYGDVNDNGVYDSGTDAFIGQGSAFESDNGSVNISTTGQTITAGTSQNWLLVYNFADSANTGETFFSRIVQNSDINAVGATSTSPILPSSVTFPVSGNIQTVSTVGSITLAEGSGNPLNSNIASDESNVEMLQLQLTASSAETLKIADVQFKASGTGDDVNDISTIYLYHDLNDNGDLNVGVDTLIASVGPYATDDGTITFTFADSIILPASTTQNWLVVYDMAGSAANGATFQANVELATYISGNGAITGQPMNVSGSFPISSAIKTISNVGAIVISAGANNPSPSTEASNAVNIEVLQVNFAASAAESLLVDTVSFTAIGSIDDLNDITLVSLYKDMNNNGILDLTIDEQIDSSRAFNANDGKVTFFTSDTILPSAAADWLVIYNLSGSASGGETFRVRLDVGDLVATGIESGSPVTQQGLPLTSEQKTITDVGGFTLSAGAANPGNSNITADAQDLEVIQFNLAASSVEDININSVVFRHSGTADPAVDILENHIDLYNDNGNGIFDDGVDTYIGTGTKYQNYSLNFDGTGDYVAVDADQDQAGGNTSDGITVEAWVKLSSSATAGEKIIASWDRSDYWRLALNAARRVRWSTDAGAQGTDDMYGSAVLTADTWYHVAAVYDPATGQKRIYVNGNLDATTEPYTDGTNLGSGISRYGFIGVGSEASTFNGTVGPASYWHGEIDEFRISNTVRYTANFTAPNEEFTADAFTAVLHHFSEQSGTITSNSATAYGAGNSLLNGNTSFVESDAFPGSTVTIATTGQTIDAGTSENWLLVYDLSDSASTGENFIASILKTGIVGTGATSSSIIGADGNNVSGGVKTVSAVGGVTLSAGLNNPDASTESADAQSLAMLQLQLQASAAESLLISEFQLKGEGTANELTDVSSVLLYRDLNSNGVYDDGVDVQIGISQTFAADDGVVTFSFAPAETLAAGTQENWLVVYNLAGSASNSESMQARIELASYMTVTGLTSAESITPAGSFAITGGIKTISNIGRLQVNLGTNTPAEGTVGLDATDAEVIQLHFVTNSAESLRVDSLHFTPAGTMNHSLGITSTRLYRDVNGNGILDLVGDLLLGTATYSDSLDVLSFSTADTLAPNATTDYLLVYDMSGGGTVGQNFRAQIVVDADIYTTGLSGSPHAGTVIGPPIQGNILTLSGKGSLSIAAGPANPTSSNEPTDALNLSMMQVRFTASNVEDVNINGVTLTAAGTADDVSDIINNGIKLYHDVNSNGIYDSGTDQFIGQGTAYGADNGTVTIATTGQTVARGTSVDWIVLYDLAGSASTGETFIARLLQASNIVARGATSDSVITAEGSLPVVGGTKTISTSGSITLATGSNNPVSGSISDSDQDIEMLQLQMSASSAETLLVSQVQFKAAGTGIDQTDISGVTLYNDLNNNGLFDSGVDTALAPAGTYAADNGIITFAFADSVEIPAGATVNWLVVYDMGGSAANSATFSLAMELNSYMTVTGKSTATPITPNGSFPITSAAKTVTSVGVLTLTAGLNNPGASVEANNATNIVMMQLNYASSAAESLLVDSVSFTALGSIDDLNDISVAALYLDNNSNGVLDLTIDQQIDSSRAFSADNGIVTFYTNDTLLPSTDRNWLLVYNLSGSATGGETFRARLGLGDAYVTGIESAGPANVQGIPITSAEKTITDVGGMTLAIGPANPGNSNITADVQDMPMVQFTLTASSVEDVDVSNVTFRHSGTADPAVDILENHIDLYADDGDGIYEPGVDSYIGTGTKYQNYGVSFDGTDDYIAVDADQTEAGGITSNGITVEAWVNLSSSATAGEKIIASWDRSDYWRLALNNARRVRWSTDAGAAGTDDMYGSAVLAADTWYHVAVVYDPATGQKRIYVNGNLDATSEAYPDGTNLGSGLSRYGFIGVGSEATTFNGTLGPLSYWHGEIDEFRISNTVRYTSSFTAPTGEFTADANTSVLHHFSEQTGNITINSATSGGAGNSLLNGDVAFVESDAFPGVTVTIATTGQVIGSGTSQDWLLVYDLSDSASVGETFIASVLRTGIVATGSTSGSSITPTGVNVSGGVKTVSTIGNLTISNGVNNPDASNISPDESEVVMQQIRFTASSAESLVVSQFQVKASGTGNEATGVDSAAIYFDANQDGLFTSGIDEKLAAAQNVTQDDQVLTFTTSDTVPAGSSRNWIVLYYFNNTVLNNETFRTGIELNSYVTAENLLSESREVLGAPFYGEYKTVSDVGVLTIQAGTSNPTAHNEGSNATNIEMLQLLLSSSSAESLAVQSITLTASGSIDESTDVLGAKLYNDVNNNGILDLTQDIQLSTTQTFTQPNGTVLFTLSPAETLLASSTENWLVVYDLNGNATAGENFRISLVDNADIDVDGLESAQSADVLGAPVTGNDMTVQDIGSLALYGGTNNPGNSNETADASNLEMLQINLVASSVENIRVDSLRFSAAGTANDLADISTDGVRLYLDDGDGIYEPGVDNLIGTPGNYDADNGYFMLNTAGEVINASENENWLLVYDLGGSAAQGETFIARFLEAADIYAVGVSSDSAAFVTVDGAAPSKMSGLSTEERSDMSEAALAGAAGVMSAINGEMTNIMGDGGNRTSDSPIVGGTKTITILGSLSLSAGSNNPLARNIGSSDTLLTVLQLALGAGNSEDLDISSLRFTAAGTGNDATDITSVRLFDDLDGNGQVDVTDPQIGTTQTYAADNGSVIFSSLTETITAGTTKNWLLVYNLNGSASNSEYFSAGIALNSHVTATGVTTSQSITATGAPVNGNNQTVSDVGTLTLSAGANMPDASNEDGNATNVSMLQLNLAANSVEDITVTSIAFDGEGTGDEPNDVSAVNLYHDIDNNGIYNAGTDTLIGSGTFSGNTVTLGSLNADIPMGTNQNWIVLFNFAGATDGTTFRTRFADNADITITGASGNPSAIGAPIVGNFKTISTIGTLTIAEGSNNSVDVGLDRSATNVEMLQILLTASSVEDVDVSSVVITHNGTGDPVNDIVTNSVRLVRDVNNNGDFDSGTDVVLDNTSFQVGDTAVFTLTGVSITAGDFENWLVVYDFDGGVVHNTTFQARVVNGGDVTATGATSATSITPDASYPLRGGTITLSSFSNLGLAGSDLTANPLPGDENVAILQVDMTVDQNISTIYSMRIDNRAFTGTPDAADIDSIKIFQEDGTSGGFQPAEDILLGGETVTDDGSGGFAVITFASQLDLTTTGGILYIVYDIAPTANTANSVGVRINSASYLSVNTPTTILDAGDFPIQSTQDYSLPVELTAFEATGEPGAIVIKWTTESEVNNLGFIVERRLTEAEKGFSVVASYKTVVELQGQGNSSSKHQYSYRDETVESEVNYEYRLIQVDLDGSERIAANSVQAAALEKIPDGFALNQNYPNPFNPETQIEFSLPEAKEVTLIVYDMLGNKVVEIVRNQKFEAGTWTVRWNGKDERGNQVSTGVYFYTIRSGNFVDSKKMTLVK